MEVPVKEYVKEFDHTEINRLTMLLRERDAEIHRLLHRPREHEVVVEKVVDTLEIDRLNQLLNTKDHEIEALRRQPPIQVM